MEGFGLEVGAVRGQDEPVVDGAAEEVDVADGGEFFAQGWAGRVRGFGEDQPHAVVLRGFCVIAEHGYDFVSDVDGVAAEHVPGFRV